MTTTTYTEAEITEAVELYADFYGVEPQEVEVSRNYEDGRIIGFRLSLDGDGRQRGADKKIGFVWV